MRAQFFFSEPRKFGQEPRGEVSAEIDMAVEFIRSTAGVIIIERYPQYLQANMTARAVELLSSGDVAGVEWAEIIAAWKWVKNVRAESKRARAVVILAASVEDIDLAVAGINWPA